MQSQLFYELVGGFAALVSAASWAFSSILFRRIGDKISPLSMNFVKCLIGVLFLGAILLITGAGPVSMRAFVILGISGLLGITFGDTLFFKALISLGPRLAVLLGATVGPVVTVILAMIFLKERISFFGGIGIFLTLSGVAYVLGEKFSLKEKGEEQKEITSGVKCMLLSILCTSVGIILVKIGVVSVSPLQATFFRFSWAIIGLAIWGGLTRQLKKWIIPFKDDFPLLKLILVAVCVAIFGGFWLFILSLKYIDASIATVLNSTTPLFILPMVVFMLKDKITPRAIIGAIVAVGGIILIFIR